MINKDWSLKKFAEWYLGDGGVLKLQMEGEGALRVGPNSTELVLFREPPFQATLVTFFPEYHVPPHTHEFVDVYALSMTGNGVTVVGGHHWQKKVQDHPRLDLRIPVLANVEHSGYTKNGSVFLALQKWRDGNPRFLSDDWVSDTPFGNIRKSNDAA